MSILIFLISVLYADVFIEDFVPLGYKEYFMANAGVAMEASPGNTIFNPAGLGFYKLNKEIYTSGFQINKYETQNDASVDVTSDVVFLPALTTTVLPSKRRLTLAYFIYTPIELQFKFNYSGQLNTADYSSVFSGNSEVQQKTIRLGGSIAYSFNTNTSLGVSIIFCKDSTINRSNFTYDLEVYSPSSTTSLLSTSTEQIDYHFLNLPLGLLTQITPSVSWGIKITPPLIPIHAKGKSKNTSLSTSGEKNDEPVTSFTPKARSPIAINSGFMIHVSELITLYPEVGYRAPEHYKSIQSNDNIPTDINRSGYHWERIGSEINLTENQSVLLGISYQSKQKTKDQDDFPSYISTTTGFLIKKGVKEFMLGGYLIMPGKEDGANRDKFYGFSFMSSFEI